MSLSTDYEWFEYEMAINGLSSLLVSSHEDAASSPLTHSIVYVPNKENGKLDVYLVGKKDGLLVEYVCWVSDEFVEDEELIYKVLEYIQAGYKGPQDVATNLLTFNPSLNFTTYSKEEYPNLKVYQPYAVIARPFYREHAPFLKKVLAENEQDAHTRAMHDRDLKETLEAKLENEMEWNEEVIEKYWSLYR